ncbi:alpha/beta hydrolase [Micromonospora sp. KC213]|nr:alpha/beta hydrolase [Micromonospora sp. KC213]
MYVHRYGDPAARPVVALHGIRGHGGRWRHLAERHLRDSYVVAPDLRGHGRSDGTPPWSVERHVDDVLGVLDELGLDRVDVIGHSFGGLIALYLTRTAPHRVARLALLDPSVGLDPHGVRENAHRSLVVPSFADQVQARSEREAAWPYASPEVLDDDVAEHLAQGSDGRWRWRFEAAAVVTAYSDMARPALVPTVPTLLLIGQRAGFVRPEFVADCRAALGADLTVAELDCGHMLYLERPDEVGGLLRPFLTGNRSMQSPPHNGGDVAAHRTTFVMAEAGRAHTRTSPRSTTSPHGT